jgi:putative DNA primase/helicase
VPTRPVKEESKTKAKPIEETTAKAKFDEVLEEIEAEAEFKEAPKTKFTGATTKPTILLSGKPWTNPNFMLIVDRTLLHLKDASAGIYQRGNVLVRLIEELAVGERGERIKVWKLTKMSEKVLERKMMDHIAWTRKVKVKSKQDEADKMVEQPGTPIGSKIAPYALEMRGYWPFPVVEGVISAPTLKPSGTLLNELGYDQETGLILINSPEVEINPRPSRAEGEAAIELLRDLYVETKFANAGARAVALSLDLSTVLCGAIRNTPLVIISAPKGGNGKTYLVQIACVLAFGEKGIPMGRTVIGEEFEKRLASLFVEGRQLIFLDNHNGKLQSDLICQAVTGDKVLIRKFGTLGENVEVSTRAVIAATGNGISIADDLDRRTLMIKLDTGLADPHFKKYAKRPLDLILADRAKYLKAALTIPLAYREAGYPVVTDKQLLDFEDWDRLVRRSLIWLGETDPLVTMDEASDTDVGKQQARAMRMAMKTLCGLGEGNAHFAEHIVNQIDANGSMCIKPEVWQMAKAWREVLMAIVAGGKEETWSRRLGHWFNKVRNVPDDGLVIRSKVDTHTAMNVWWVEEVV